MFVIASIFTLCLAGANCAVIASDIEYLGSAWYLDYRVGKFKVDGRYAFCMDHYKSCPYTGCPITSKEIMQNNAVKAILYYGYAGIENQVGNDDTAIVATTLALDSVMNGEVWYRRNIPGYNLLMEHARKQDAPSMDASFSRSYSEAFIENGVQRSETVTFNADYRNSIDIPVVYGTTLWVDGTPHYSGNVTVRGGQSFWVSAPLNYGKTICYEGLKPKLKLLNTIMYRSYSSEYQRLVRNTGEDPLPVNNLRLHFKTRERNVNIQYVDAVTGEVLGQKNEKGIVGSNFDYTAPETYGKNGDGTYSLTSRKHATGTIGDTDLTIKFFYDFSVAVHIRHIDNRTGRLISESNDQMMRNSKYCYMPSKNLTCKGYTYRPVSEDVFEGTISNKNLEFSFYYDIPLAEIGLKSVQIHTVPSDTDLEVETCIDKIPTIYDLSVPDMQRAMITISLYDGKDLIERKSFNLKNLPKDLSFLVPSELLSDNQSKMYYVRLEGFDENQVIILPQAFELGTLGYTSSRKQISANPASQREISYSGVIMTKHTAGTPMKEYFERFKISVPKIEKERTGYGFEMPVNFEYSNEMEEKYSTDFSFSVPECMVDDYIPYVIKNNTATADLEKTAENILNKQVNRKYEFPHVNVEMLSGKLFSDQQIASHDSRRNYEYEVIDGGRKFYTPIWSTVGKYPTKLENKTPIGVNEVDITFNDEIELFAHMICHMDSPTIEDDAILWTLMDEADPVFPKSWSYENIRIFKEKDPKYMKEYESYPGDFSGKFLRGS